MHVLVVGVMVEAQEPAEYVYELRAIAENIGRERCETSEVPPPAPTQHEPDVHTCEVDSTNVSGPNVNNTSNLSQVTLDWKDLVFPTPGTSLNAVGALAKEVDVPGKSQVIEPAVAVAVDTFAEVCEIADEAVIDATHAKTA